MLYVVLTMPTLNKAYLFIYYLSVVIVLQNVIELSVLISTRGRYSQSFRYTQTGYPQEF